MTDFAKRPLLILDLDETLIYGSQVELHRPADFRIGPFHIYERPYLRAFLNTVSVCYDMAVWSSASPDYVEAVAKQLARDEVDWRFVWSRTRCVQRLHPDRLEEQFIKDLKKVKRRGYDLERILIVDDTRSKVARNYGNAIYVRPFEGGDNDDELLRLRGYLIELWNEPTFRTIEKRSWRTTGRH